MRKLTSKNELFFIDKDKAIAELRELWERILSPTPLPPLEQFQKWAAIHNYQTEALEVGFRAAARRQKARVWNDNLHCIAFVSSVSNCHRSVGAARIVETKKAA